MLNKPEAAHAKAGHGHGDTIVKRSARRHDDHAHGGAWKVAFADFCLALLCLFLVLWLMASRDKEKANEALRAAGAGMLAEGSGSSPVSIGGPTGSLIDRSPVPSQGDTPMPRKKIVNGSDTPQLSKGRYDNAADLPELQLALAQLGIKAGMKDNLQTVITPVGLRVLLHDTEKQGIFEVGSARPSAKLQSLLQTLGPLFAQIENQLLVIGHTDALPFMDQSHSAISNWSLSSDRAMVARTHLLIGGMPQKSVLQVVGMADAAPLDREHPRAAANRRIELMIVSTTQSRAMQTMFGTPAWTTPLIDGADAAGGGGPATNDRNRTDTNGAISSLTRQLTTASAEAAPARR